MLSRIECTHLWSTFHFFIFINLCLDIGWHRPYMQNVLPDNLSYMRSRYNFAATYCLQRWLHRISRVSFCNGDNSCPVLYSVERIKFSLHGSLYDRLSMQKHNWETGTGLWLVYSHTIREWRITNA